MWSECRRCYLFVKKCLLVRHKKRRQQRFEQGLTKYFSLLSASLRQLPAKFGQVEWNPSLICCISMAIFDECLNFWCNRSKQEEIWERKWFSPPERCGQNRPLNEDSAMRLTQCEKTEKTEKVMWQWQIYSLSTQHTISLLVLAGCTSLWCDVEVTVRRPRATLYGTNKHIITWMMSPSHAFWQLLSKLKWGHSHAVFLVESIIMPGTKFFE